MFGRDPRIPLNTLLEPKIRYMGTDEIILSLEALQRIYYMEAENLKLARERQTKQKPYHPIKLTRKPYGIMQGSFWVIMMVHVMVCGDL